MSNSFESVDRSAHSARGCEWSASNTVSSLSRTGAPQLLPQDGVEEALALLAGAESTLPLAKAAREVPAVR